MSSNIKVPKEKFSQFNLRIDKKADFVQGELVKIVDDKGEVLDYAYLIKDVYFVQGYPFVMLKTQRTDKTMEMVVTNAIQKFRSQQFYVGDLVEPNWKQQTPHGLGVVIDIEHNRWDEKAITVCWQLAVTSKEAQ